MDCFNGLLLKLQEVHEREVEGWQGKIQELSNKKGCDTKRMEELFSKNQQMKEQQRVLTENIKTLENRLRAGLCDRCTVTQEVAKRRQQEFESSQIQSIQHITLLAGEMNNLKRENKQLVEELSSIKAAFNKGPSDHSSNSNSATPGVKPNSSPDLSPSSGPVALVTKATSRERSQPADGSFAMKTETVQRAEESEHRRLRGMHRSYSEFYKPLSWRTEHGATHLRARSREVNPTRHVLHAPVPCRPKPIKSSPVSFPWPTSESSDWVTAASPGTSLVQPSPNPNLPRFPNLIPTSQHAVPVRQVFESPWQKQSAPQPNAKEPTVVFRLRSVPEQVEGQTKPQEKKEVLPFKTESFSAEGTRDAYDWPLDLSDRGHSKSSQMEREDSPLSLHTEERVQASSDNGMANPPSPGTVPSPSEDPLLCSWTQVGASPPVKQEEEDFSTHYNHTVVREQEQKEEVNDKKVPILTISLRPVVVLENLNSALQESLSSNGKSWSKPTEAGNGSEEQGEEVSMSVQERNHGGKRKRAPVEIENQDSETDHIEWERNIEITLRNEEKSTC
ncbi:uncharacterized protein rbbp8l isoform 2-T7 [Spinachia spinachia]